MSVLIAEPAVLVPARCAGTFVRMLEQWARGNGGLPPHLSTLEVEFRTAAAAYQRITLEPPPAGSADGTAEPSEHPLDGTLSVMETAAILGCSTRNVRKLAARESLTGRQIAGRWQFDRDDVAAWAAERRTA